MSVLSVVDEQVFDLLSGKNILHSFFSFYSVIWSGNRLLGFVCFAVLSAFMSHFHSPFPTQPISLFSPQLTGGRGAPPATSTAVTSTKPALYDPLRLTYDAALEDTVVTGLTVSTVTSASEAMQSFARACQAASAGTGELQLFLVFLDACCDYFLHISDMTCWRIAHAPVLLLFLSKTSHSYNFTLLIGPQALVTCLLTPTSCCS